MPEALHPQILVYGMNGENLAPDHGAPVRLRIPRQLGYKNVKYIARISVVDSPQEHWRRQRIRGSRDRLLLVRWNLRVL